MTKFILLICCLSIVLFQPVEAQKKTDVPAFLITNQNDTLKGVLDYGDWIQSPTEIEFTIKGKKEIYKATDVKGFIVIPTQEVFISRFVTISYQGREFEVFEIDSMDVFLRTLVKGKFASLHRMEDKTTRERFFLEKPDGTFVELIHFEREGITRYEEPAILRSNEYKNQMRLYLGYTTGLNPAPIPAYNRREMTDYFLLYNANLGDVPGFMEKKQSGTLNLLLMAGGVYNHVYKSEVNSVVGLGLRYNLPGANRNRHIIFEAHREYAPNAVRIFSNGAYGYLFVNDVSYAVELTVGSYFGKKDILTFVRFGFIKRGFLDEGGVVGYLGLSYKKRVDLNLSFRAFSKGDFPFIHTPKFTLQYNIGQL